MELHFLEMPKLLIDWKKGNLNPKDDPLARWLLMLGMVDRRNKIVHEDIYEELEAIAMTDKTLRGVFEDWEKLSANKDKQHVYETRVKEVMDAYAAKREAELELKDATEKAFKKGNKEATVSIAKKMVQEGIDLKSIKRFTGLDTKEIEKL